MILNIKKLAPFTFVLFFLSGLLVNGQDLTMADVTVDSEIDETVESPAEPAEEVAEDESPLSISGSVDTYFRSNLGDSYSYGAAPATSFANLPGFSLGMANVVLGLDGEKAGFTADLVFGPRGEDATFLSGTLRPVIDGFSNNSSIVNQLYAYWNINENLTATLGNFNTFLGYEVISPSANFNYSTSYMFSYGPFSHTGLKLDADLGNGFSLMAGIFNPTDATEFNPGTFTDNDEIKGDYAGGAQLGYSFDDGSAFLNAIVSDGFFQLDLTAGMDVSDKVYVGVNATTAKDAFSGAALYLQVAASDDFKVGARAEYFLDQGVGVTLLDESILDFTLSANYSVGNLTLIPEFRIDTFSADGVDPLSSVLVAAVFSF